MLLYLIRHNVRQLFAADDFSRRHFQMLFFLGALRVNAIDKACLSILNPLYTNGFFFWFDTINLGWSIVHIKNLQVFWSTYPKK